MRRRRDEKNHLNESESGTAPRVHQLIRPSSTCPSLATTTTESKTGCTARMEVALAISTSSGTRTHVVPRLCKTRLWVELAQADPSGATVTDVRSRVVWTASRLACQFADSARA